MGIENFEKLPCEKQIEIINAAIEVFGRNEHKKASTEEISRRAGISKGMLFYYFKDKKSLYIYDLDYINNLVSRRALWTGDRRAGHNGSFQTGDESDKKCSLQT